MEWYLWEDFVKDLSRYVETKRKDTFTLTELVKWILRRRSVSLWSVLRKVRAGTRKGLLIKIRKRDDVYGYWIVVYKISRSHLELELKRAKRTGGLSQDSSSILNFLNKG